MRICLVVHGFPPYERTGVENYTGSLAAALVRAGHAVEVFTRCPAEDLPDLALRREEVNGYGVNWLATGREPSDPEEMLNPPGVAGRFGAFLDRERPELVHFQHVVKLGTALISEARRRGIPTVYTAHDYYAHCHRYTLLRPDLTRCETIGDPKLCARCDQSLALLNRVKGLGDYQMGALEEQLRPKVRTQLAAILDGKPTKADLSKQAAAASVKLREQLDARRLRDFRELDLILAPTQFLRARLIEGGLDEKKIKHLPYGIETGELEKIAASHPVGAHAGDPHGPLRVGFFGGFSKHKGVHVLLDAFGRLRQPAELLLYGLGTDQPYVELLEKRAQEVGARWCGPYQPEELPAAMAEVDVVVVPSLWVENYPIVIREAFAAKRPVITSRLGALPESVSDGVDGFLFEPGNAEELAEILERCATQEGLLVELAKGIKPVHKIDKQAKELGKLYRSVKVLEKKSRKDPAPASLQKHIKRYEELSALPTRELFKQTMVGLKELSGKLLGKSGTDTMELLVGALSRGSNVQDQLRDRRREADWVKRTLREEEKELKALTKKLDWMDVVVVGRDEKVESLQKEREWLEQSILSKREEVQALNSERDEQERARVSLDKQREWLQGALDSKSAQIEEMGRKEQWLQGVLGDKHTRIEELLDKEKWLQEVLEGNQAQIAHLESELEGLVEARESLDKEILWLEETLRDKEQLADESARVVKQKDLELEQQNAQLQKQDKQLQEQDKHLQKQDKHLKYQDDQLQQQGELIQQKEKALKGSEKRLQAESDRLRAQEAISRERGEMIEQQEQMELELRTWLESMRDMLESRQSQSGDGSENEELVTNTASIWRQWESVLTDFERLLDSEQTEVTADELGLRVGELFDRLDEDQRELHWRRGEMDWIADKTNRGIGGLVLTLARMRARIRNWSPDAERSPDTELGADQ